MPVIESCLIVHSLLSKAKEKLEILAALGQATEQHGEQKRKRKDAPTDIQPTKTKKARMYIHPRDYVLTVVMRFAWVQELPFTFRKRNNLTLNGFSAMSFALQASLQKCDMRCKILNQMIME